MEGLTPERRVAQSKLAELRAAPPHLTGDEHVWPTFVGDAPAVPGNRQCMICHAKEPQEVPRD